MSDKKDITDFNNDLANLIDAYLSVVTIGEIAGSLTMAQHLVIKDAIDTQEQSNVH